MRYIVGIDPGNIASAYCIVDEDLRPVSKCKLDNELMYCQLVEDLCRIEQDGDEVHVAIEMIASYGMPVGKEVFDTCVWIGMLMERLKQFEPEFVYRKDEKMAICHSSRANDATIRQALIDRFAPGEPNHGKGTKKEPGWFYGFRADMWAAYAVAVTYHDMRCEMAKGG